MEISSTNQSSDSENSSQEPEYHLEESKLDSDPSSYSSKHSQSYDDESSIGTIIDLGEETIMEEENYWEKCSIEETLQISLPAFGERVGVSPELRELRTPIEFFQLYFSNDVFEDICDYTDRYYQQKHGKNNRKRDSHHRK